MIDNPVSSVAAEFFAALFPDGSINADRRCVLSKTEGKPCFHAQSRDALLAELVKRKGDAMFSTCLHSPKLIFEEAARQKKEPNLSVRRGYNVSTVFVPALRLDVDFGTDHDGNRPYPPDEAAALRLVDEMPLPPSIDVRTGGGLHLYWLIDPPVEIATDEERHRAAVAMKGWLLLFEGLASPHGWSVDPTADLARVLRPPGFQHPLRQEVEIMVNAATTDYDRRYGLEQLEEFIPDDVKLSPMRGDARVSRNGASGPLFTDEERESALELVEHLCKFDAQFQMTWDRRRKDLNDDQNRYDASLASYAIQYESTPAVVAALIVEHRTIHGRDPGKILERPDLVDRVIALAKADDSPHSAKADDAPHVEVPDETPPVVPVAESESAAEPSDNERYSKKLTDTGNAERIVEWYGHRFRYVPGWRKFLVYEGGRWKRDGSAEMVLDLTKRMTRRLMSHAAKLRAEAVFKHAVRSEAKTSRVAMVELLKAEESIHAEVADLDRKPYLLNFKNGTLDLKTGVLRKHEPADMLTKRLNLDYDHTATCPQWEQFMREVVPDDEVRRFLQRAVGMSLVGTSLEQVLFILHGPGLNGKTTFLEVLLRLLGEYAKAMPPKLLLKRGRNEAHPTELRDLYAVRVSVCTEEPSGGAEWDFSKIKRLTGGDTISARGMHEDFWTFTPSHSIWVALNQLPRVTDRTPAFWRRIVVVPFYAVVSTVDKTMTRKLLSEAQGILRWAVEGCREYMRAKDLHLPEAVVQATERYRAESDPVGRWLSKVTRDAPGAKVRSTELYERYADWWDRKTESPAMSITAFSGRIKDDLWWTKKHDEKGAFWADREWVPDEESQ